MSLVAFERYFDRLARAFLLPPGFTAAIGMVALGS